MVRYEKDITLDALNTAVETEKPGWLNRAKTRTDKFRTKGAYDESSGIWSEIKAVYMTLQGNKCAFCERELESVEFGKIEHDVEHFRPKRNARGWPTDKIREKLGIDFDFPAGERLDEGYFLLAYHPLNYVTSCKTCNSTLKSDFFPIKKSRVRRQDHPEDYRAEEPYLFYPIGDGDIDPEKAFTFEGIFPVPVHASGKKRLRSLVTIAFFQLASRETLLKQRARRIVDFSRAYEDSIVGSSVRKRDRGAKDVERMTRATSPHANCIRSFHRRCIEDPNRAQEILDAVFDYLDSIDPEG